MRAKPRCGDAGASTYLDRESGYKYQQLSAAADCCCQQVVVSDEPFGVLLPEPELNKKADSKINANGGVNAHGKVAKIPQQDWRDEVVEAKCWETTVQEVEGQWEQETERQCEDNPRIGTLLCVSHPLRDLKYGVFKNTINEDPC